MNELEKRLEGAPAPGWEQARRSLVERADRESLFDLAYERHESPFGTLLVFAGFSAWYLGQPLKWNHWAGFALIAVAAWLIFLE